MYVINVDLVYFYPSNILPAISSFFTAPYNYPDSMPTIFTLRVRIKTQSNDASVALTNVLCNKKEFRFLKIRRYRSVNKCTDASYHNKCTEASS